MLLRLLLGVDSNVIATVALRNLECHCDCCLALTRMSLRLLLGFALNVIAAVACRCLRVFWLNKHALLGK